ncbi:uncharacterized protein LOC142520660 [Primulina tabacum]|uniref:uncharacterized protein LOC142520660 n=1 Tax=Primulina tabacum TaxID=48773 RepID=UPI003F5AC0FC
MKVMIPFHRNRSEEIYFSAPSSPSNLSDQICDTVFDDFDNSRSSVSVVPFGWEEKPGTPKSSTNNDDFEFAFSVGKVEPETVSLSAEELFHGGVIKPLKPPPCLQVPPCERIKEFTHKKSTPAISLPPLLLTRKMIHGALSPRHKNKESVDPFEIAAQNATRSDVWDWDARGRERNLNLQKSSSRKASRSLSPCRVTKYAWEDNEKWRPLDSVRMSSPSSSLCSENHKKWRLKHLFFSRITSKGRGAGEDNSKRYMATFRRWSFRDIGRPGSRRGSSRDEPASVHTISRSVSEDFMHKKKFLPYNYGVGVLVRCGFLSKKIIK